LTSIIDSLLAVLSVLLLPYLLSSFSYSYSII